MPVADDFMVFRQSDSKNEAEEKDIQHRFKKEIKEIMLSYLADEKS